MSAPAGKPRLLVLNQYYWPGVEATAQLLTDLCEALADEYEIRVLTGMLHGHELLPHSVVRNDVEIVRVRSTSFERSRIGLRGLNYASYLGSTLLTALAGPRPDLVLCMTDPPMIGDIGLAVSKRFGVPLLVISEDVFPEIATKLRRLENPVLVGVLRQLVRLYLQARRSGRRDRRDDAAAPRGKGGARGAAARDPELDRHRASITPREHENDWKREQKLAGKFVVMHSGQRGPCAGPRHARSGDDLPPRPRRPRGRDRRLRRPARGDPGGSRDGSRPTRCGSCPTSRARCCRSRSPPATSTSSALREGCPAMSCRAGCTGSSPPVVR